MACLEVEFELSCDVCRGDLTATATSSSRNIHKIVVAPCEACLSDAKDDGYSQAICETQG